MRALDIGPKTKYSIKALAVLWRSSKNNGEPNNGETKGQWRLYAIEGDAGACMCK